MPIENIKEKYSEEVQEIIGSVPHWLVRWGITLFFLVLLMVLLMSAVIQSPVLVTASLKISSARRPQEVLARKPAKLLRLFVSENQQVKRGNILGYLESTANHEDVLRLSGVVDRLQSELLRSNYQAGEALNLNTSTHYGELQQAFQEFYLGLMQFKAFTPNGAYSKKAALIQREINNLKRLEAKLHAQKVISRADYGIQEQEFEAFRKLAEANVVSLQEFRREESKFLNKKLPVETSEAALITNSSSQSMKEKELLEAQNMILEQKATFLSKVQRFKSEIDRWKFENLLVSDRNGKVVFHRLIEEQEWLDANTPVMYIADGGEENQFGELVLGQYSLGKIKKGQDVLIKLNAYPYQEFGLLKGKITYISDVLYGDTTYSAKVKLPEGLKSTYNKQLTLQAGLVAQAEVVTERRSLLSRIFNNLRSALKNH